MSGSAGTLVEVHEAAAYLGIPSGELWSELHAGRGPLHAKMHGRFRMTLHALDQWARSGVTTAAVA